MKQICKGAIYEYIWSDLLSYFCVRLILGEKYENYEDGLLKANLESLKERRQK